MPDTVDLDSAADELYAGARESFTSRRKELAKAARDQGDQHVAKEIDKLAKPTTSAWLANQLARDPSADLDQVAEVGDALRAAHANLDGNELRALSQKRTKLVARLIERAGALTGSPLTESVVRELEDILTTAVADPDVTRALLTGRLTSAKNVTVATWPSGGGQPASPVARPRQPRAEPTERESAARAREVAAARAELERARSAVKEAEADRAEEERILVDAQRAADEATERVRRVYEELDAAEALEKEARRRVGSASRSVKDAERRAGQAWRQVQQAERVLEDLGEK
ncbi:hypothetical protein BLA60_36045 [Actinophytocola xinjiangensis]|uniref:Uncharacterized protein n=1 Tax=Actinophytocola xinjiangensis TaxID=485602 RepID=A0A7Z1AU23_9PSEU|nr:hypothetical protein [Actinophytocola xinjiangensis]OLF05460.1 hypothetical protein BLA60_36045 [Actinophytocola xinjiangensis]